MGHLREARLTSKSPRSSFLCSITHGPNETPGGPEADDHVTPSVDVECLDASTMQKNVNQTKEQMKNEISNAAIACYDDNCDPLPAELFILIGLGKKKLSDYCRMRVFNTLFGWEEVEDCVREIFWP